MKDRSIISNGFIDPKDRLYKLYDLPWPESGLMSVTKFGMNEPETWIPQYQVDGDSKHGCFFTKGTSTWRDV